MKQFNKTVLAVALLAAAGSASAAIATIDNAPDLYMSVYDSTSKNTYSFDTNVTLNTLLAHVNDTSYSLSFDLSADTNWTSSFLGAVGFNAATTTYGLLVGSAINPDLLATSSAVGGAPAADSDTTLMNEVGMVANHANEINAAGGLVNNSKVVNDSATAFTGQFNDFNTLFGNQALPSAKVAGLYGSSLPFYHHSVVLDTNSGNLIGAVEKFAGGWNLSGNSLTFNAANVAAVPLPAAVWLFGAGLMGLLRLNRRK